MGSFRAFRYPVQFSRRRVPVGAEMLELRHVRDIDALIDRMTPEELRDEKIPYYGQLWPASVGLARWLWRNREPRGKRVLDLGCGVGLPGIVAARKGARVLFADYFPEALDLARENARRNGCSGQEFLPVDWRDRGFRRTFDLILASDVLYEARNHEPVLDFLRCSLPADGEAVIADPGRPKSMNFFEMAAPFFKQRAEEVAVQERELTIQVTIVSMSMRDGDRT